MRCTLRISQRGVFVDGEPMSRTDAIAYCKRTAGGAIVVIEDSAAKEWDATARAMVVIEDKATKAAWDETRAALQREGVRIYIRGPLCYDPRVLGCRPKTKPEPRPEPSRRIVPAREPLSPSAPE